MARSFHRKKTLEANSDLNVTALIDLGFALLIIFMISTKVIEKEQVTEIDLPVSDRTTATAPAESIDITIVEGSYRLDGNPYSQAELEREFERYAESDDPPVLNIRANFGEPWQNMVTLIDLLKKYKLKRINLVTKLEE